MRTNWADLELVIIGGVTALGMSYKEYKIAKWVSYDSIGEDWEGLGRIGKDWGGLGRIGEGSKVTC